MIEIAEVARLKTAGDMKGLESLLDAARGPVQRMTVNWALGEVCEQQFNWQRAVEAWRECVSCSDGDFSAWERLGDAAERVGRLPLAISSLQASYTLSGDLRVLLKVAKARLRLHDYANALSLASFVSRTNPELAEAEALRISVLEVIQGKRLYSGGLLRQRDTASPQDPETVTVKVANLLDVAKATKKLLDAKKDDAVIVFQRTAARTNFEQGSSVQTPKRLSKLSPRLNTFAEDLKLSVLQSSEPINFLSLGLHRNETPSSWKPRCSAEPGFSAFLDTPWRLQALISRLLTDLCANRPRPSPALSDELAWEVLELYLKFTHRIHLRDELLTLFELTLRGPAHFSTLQELRNSALECQSEFHTQELQLRFQYAQAWYFYRLGEQQTKDEVQQDALVTSYALLEDLERRVGDQCYYFWWCEKTLSRRAIASLKDSIRDELTLIKAGEALQSSEKSQEAMLALLTRLCSLLVKRCVKDDVAFYWRKVKMTLKPLLKGPLPAAAQRQVTQCLSQFLAVAQFNLDDGLKIPKEVDLRFIFRAVAKEILRKQSGPRTSFEGYIVLSAINIAKERKELFKELPDIMKRFGGTDEELARFFARFHSNCGEIALHDKDFHFSLCKRYEKAVFIAKKSKSKDAIYSQLYGFAVLPKDCTCGIGKSPVPDTSFPRSIGKLERFIEFAYSSSPIGADLGLYFPQTYDKAVSPALERCIAKIPDLHLSCQYLARAKDIVERLLAGGDFQHENCCSERARCSSELFYQRYASDAFEVALKREYQESFLSLLNHCETQVERLIVLNPRNSRSWLLLGQVHLHTWMAGYYDSEILETPKQQYAKYAESALRCYQVLECLEQSCQGYVYLVRGLIQFLQYRLTGSGLFDAEKNALQSLRFSQQNSPLEAVLLAALIELHIKSDQAQVLFERINAETKLYEYMPVIAAYKVSKDEERWKEVEACQSAAGYLTYVLSKRQPEKYKDDVLGFLTSNKLWETKILDRCCVYERKKAKMALRYADYYAREKDAIHLSALCKDLSVKRYPLYQRAWELAVSQLCALLQDLRDVSEMKLFYDTLEHVSNSEFLTQELQQRLVADLGQTCVKLQERFGAEACEAYKPTKRRRRK